RALFVGVIVGALKAPVVFIQDFAQDVSTTPNWFIVDVERFNRGVCRDRSANDLGGLAVQRDTSAKRMRHVIGIDFGLVVGLFALEEGELLRVEQARL